MNTNGSTTPPVKKRHRVRNTLLIIVGSLAALIIIVSVATGGGGGSSPPSNSGPAAAPASSQPGLGDKVRDGKFQFVVTAVTYTRQAGDSLLGVTAQGHFAVLHVTVTNIGTQTQTLDDSAQYVYDAAGRQFSASAEADIYLNKAGNAPFLQDINPGNSVTGLIAFDMPRHDRPVKAELHDSMFSGGVTVSLR